MTATRIVLVEESERRRHVLTLARVAATAEIVADWAEERVSSAPNVPRSQTGHADEVSLPSLLDFVTPRPPISPIH